MEYTKESVKIYESPYFAFALKCDDIKGIITLHKYKPSKSKTTRITTRSIPIDVNEKWKFYNERTGYNELSRCSYIDKKIDPITYNQWLNFMVNTYKLLKRNFKVEENLV